MVTESVICILDDLCHDHHAVQTFVSVAISHLKNTRGLSPSQIVQWSDGCAVQYKSKGPFVDIAASHLDHGITIQRSYFGARHGKGPYDGEAAVVKQHATTAVKRVELSSPLLKNSLLTATRVR